MHKAGAVDSNPDYYRRDYKVYPYNPDNPLIP